MRRVIIAFLLVAFAAPAAAQPKVSPGEKKKAEEFFRAGERAFNAKEYLVAAQALEEALKLYPVPPIIFSTAQAYRLQYFVDKDAGWLKRSIELYRMYVADVKSGGRRGDAVESLAELEPLLARLEQSSRAPIETRKL